MRKISQVKLVRYLREKEREYTSIAFEYREKSKNPELTDSEHRDIVQKCLNAFDRADVVMDILSDIFEGEFDEKKEGDE